MNPNHRAQTKTRPWQGSSRGLKPAAQAWRGVARGDLEFRNVIPRCAVILPVVLLVLTLLGLLAAMFGLRVHGDLAATQAQADALQTRLAAEAGVERVKLMLRDSRFDLERLQNNPDELHRIIVWSEGGDSTVWGKNDELDEGTPAFRFSIVADDPDDDEHFIRFGVTDEAAKLNLNKASPEQLLTLVTQVVKDDESVDPKLIVDAIVDWRDADQTPVGEDAETEGDYYESLDKPYRVKNGPFDTVEELLLVKGISGSVFNGEDFDRNGLLTLNEDDGDHTFPPDNQDGKLNRGLCPYVTVLSVEDNVSNDRRPRVSLSGDATTIQAQLKEDFPEEPDVVAFLSTAVRGQQAGRGSQPGGAGQGRGRAGSGLPRGGSLEAKPAKGQPGVGAGTIPGGRRRAGTAVPQETGPDKTGPQRQRRLGRSQPGKPNKPGGNPGVGKPPKPGANPDSGGAPPDEFGEGGLPSEDGQGFPGAEGDSGVPPTDGQSEVGGGTANPEQPGESGDVQTEQRPIRSPASLLLVGDRTSGDQTVVNPLRLEHLPILMDRTTILSPQIRKVEGLININTAPRQVLQTLEGLSETDIEAIIAKRVTLDPIVRATTAWLVTEEAISLETFDKIAAQITARGQQFMIESLGYGDHLGTVTRLQVVVDLMGPVLQTVYYRDATYVGGHFPIREKDKERIRVR